MNGKESKWIRIEYEDQTTGGIYGYTRSVQNSYQLIEVFEKYEISRNSVVFFSVNDVLQTTEEIDQVFLWYEKKLKELNEDEKRKATKQKAENSNSRS